ncbi:MAG: DedA family protein [Rickettsiales bacterium]|nr:DedA family protein [Rickettsiales bacterium]
MSLMEAYLFLFFDSIMSVLIFVPNTEMVYKAMQIFEGYNQYFMMIIASCGAVVGGVVNHLFGRALHSLKQRINTYEDSDQFKHLALYVDKNLFWMLALSVLPVIGVVITVASGFFRVRYYKVVLTILLSRIFYYMIIHDLF